MHKGRLSAPGRTWKLTLNKGQITGQILGVCREHEGGQPSGHSYGLPATASLWLAYIRSDMGSKLAGPCVGRGEPRVSVLQPCVFAVSEQGYHYPHSLSLVLFLHPLPPHSP